MHNDYSRLRIISAGVKSFVRQDSQQRVDIPCKWRIPNDGMLEILPHIGDGVVIESSLKALRVLVEEQYPTFDMFDEETRGWVGSAGLGNWVVRFAPGNEAGGQ